MFSTCLSHWYCCLVFSIFTRDTYCISICRSNNQNQSKFISLILG